MRALIEHRAHAAHRRARQPDAAVAGALRRRHDVIVQALDQFAVAIVGVGRGCEQHVGAGPGLLDRPGHAALVAAQAFVRADPEAR